MIDLDAKRARNREYQRKRRLCPNELEKDRQRQRIYSARNPQLHRDRVVAWKQRALLRDPEGYRKKQADGQKIRYKNTRERLLAGYGSICACCGESEPCFLEIDHVNGGGSKHFQVRGGELIYRDIIKLGFPKEYQLLCSNCNRGHERNNGLCPHETR